MAASSSSAFANEGPVLNLIYKCIRALRKKLKRISQMVESLSQGKTLNKEQEKTFRSKSSILARIDQLENLLQPLLQALTREVCIALEKKKKEETDAKLGGGNKMKTLVSVFYVKTLMSDEDNILTRKHERSCFLTSDHLKDDDDAGELGSRLLISRPVNSGLSHKKFLEKCVERANLWIAHSEQPIEPNSNITSRWNESIFKLKILHLCWEQVGLVGMMLPS
ncbi:hypothetical protein ACJIZ3_011183 [Penstemon smallii]|uniref:Uncharacterized protein n=1 Tax=Penstemon smallii TaxID=265156 RepID=A0ABD3UKL8_9LAMI